MKRYIAFATALLILHTSSLAPAEEEQTSNTTRVTLDYPEFRKLLEQAQIATREKPPEIPTAFLQATYRVDGNQPGRVGVTWQVEQFADGWHLIPVAPCSLALQPDGDGSAPLVRQNNLLGIVSKEPGRLETTAIISADEEELPGGGRIWEFPILPAAINQISLTGFPEGKQVRVSGGTQISQDGGEITFLLSPSQSRIRIELREETPEQPAIWEWHSEITAVPMDHALHCQARIHSSLLSGEGREIRIPLPSNARGIRLQADKEESWAVQNLPDGRQELVVRWGGSLESERLLDLTYRLQVEALAPTWIVAGPEPSGGRQNLFAIQIPPTASLSSPLQIPNARPEQLSGWMQKQLEQKPFALLRAGATGEVRVDWYEQAKTAELVIHSAKMETRIVADGSILTRATYELENEDASAWVFSLPEGSRLLHCSLGETPIRPLIKESQLEIPLPRAEKNKRKEVSFSYTQKIPALDPVSGGLSVSLPRTETFIHLLEWTLHLPEGYEVAGVESNSEVLASQTTGALQLRKRLCDGVTPLAEVFYRKSGIH